MRSHVFKHAVAAIDSRHSDQATSRDHRRGGDPVDGLEDIKTHKFVRNVGFETSD